jgi:DNA (cytosine-5)-methyltransferase 3A
LAGNFQIRKDKFIFFIFVLRRMNVLSLFDGISCAKVALEKADIPISNYYACEIDKYAIKVSKKNHPTIKQIGDVKEVKIPFDIDILIGGSPCQDLSIAKKDRKGLQGNRSSLFWEYVRILHDFKPKYFILENVASMSQTDKETITKTLGVEPIMINASLVSAQNRKRLFWTNIPNVTLPEDRNIRLRDILETSVDEKYLCKKPYTLRENSKIVAILSNDKSLSQANRIYDTDGKCATLSSGGGGLYRVSQANRIYGTDEKSVCLSSNGGGLGAKTGLYKMNDIVRRLTPVECERLQGLPDKYTEGVSDTQRYKCLGNAFNVDVIKHILSFIAKQEE